MLLSSVSPQAQRKRCEKGEKGTAHPYIVSKTEREKTGNRGGSPGFYCLLQISVYLSVTHRITIDVIPRER